MRSVFRFLLHALELLSLLLFLVCLILWIRSYFVADKIVYSRNAYASDGSLISRIENLRSNYGAAQISVGHVSSLMYRPISPREEGLHYVGDEPRPVYMPSWVVWSHFGFTYGRLDHAMLGERIVIVPFWFLCIFFGLLPALSLIKRRRRQMPLHLCRTCGYDMRATPNRCPECGTSAVLPAGAMRQ